MRMSLTVGDERMGLVSALVAHALSIATVEVYVCTNVRLPTGPISPPAKKPAIWTGPSAACGHTYTVRVSCSARRRVTRAPTHFQGAQAVLHARAPAHLQCGGFNARLAVQPDAAPEARDE